jgi:hypothetical protein
VGGGGAVKLCCAAAVPLSLNANDGAPLAAAVSNGKTVGAANVGAAVVSGSGIEKRMVPLISKASCAMGLPLLSLMVCRILLYKILLLYMDVQHFIVDWMGIITFIIFVLLFLGFLQKEPTYFIEATFIFKVFISLYLIYRFNDFRKNIKFTELDRKVCLLAGIYLLLFAIGDLIQVYLIKIKIFLKPYLPFIK